MYIIVCMTLHTATRKVTPAARFARAKIEDAVSRVFVAVQVSSGLFVDGWEHLRTVAIDDAVDRLRAVLEWDTEVVDKVFVQLQQSDDIKAFDAKMSAQGDNFVCVRLSASITAYLDAVGINM
jgi:hypothetical protein